MVATFTPHNSHKETKMENEEIRSVRISIIPLQ